MTLESLNGGGCEEPNRTVLLKVIYVNKTGTSEHVRVIAMCYHPQPCDDC